MYTVATVLSFRLEIFVSTGSTSLLAHCRATVISEIEGSTWDIKACTLLKTFNIKKAKILLCFQIACKLPCSTNMLTLSVEF